MIRNWVTVMCGHREIERMIHTGEHGRYINVHGKRLSVARLEKDGRIVDHYQFGKQNEREAS